MNKYIFSTISFLLLVNLGVMAQTTSSKSVFGQTDEELFNFEGRIYYLPEGSYKLPDFTQLTPVGKIYTNYLNIENQSFQKGFPGVTDRFEYFAIDYIGRFYIKESGEFCFKLGSDDGSKLLIDDSLVINNDWQHAIIYRSTCLHLDRGVHKIEVQYFQGPRFEVALQLTFKKRQSTDFLVFDLTQLYPVSIIETGNTIEVSISDEILFDFNSSSLGIPAKQALAEVKRLLLDRVKYQTIEICGFTDDVGSDAYNLTLSQQRADAVKRYISSLGIDSKMITSRGVGESSPKVQNLDEASRRINRRVELTILKDTVK